MENLPVAEQPKITKKEIDDYLYGSGTKLTEQQKAMFYQMSVINNLNPFRREIYAIPYGDRFNIVTGYEVYLKRAERSGKLAGWRAEVTGSGADLKGVCTIWRKDWKEPLVIEAWYAEYNQNNKMWREKPRTMIRKVAIAQGFRMAFPEELGGMPYTSDEMPQEASIEVVDLTQAEIVDPGPSGDVTQASEGQPAKVNKAIQWTLKQGMPVEEIVEAIGYLDKITEDDLPRLKEAYMKWKDQPKETDRDELPNTHMIYCDKAGGEKVTLEQCRTSCLEYPSYRECPDYKK